MAFPAFPPHLVGWLMGGCGNLEKHTLHPHTTTTTTPPPPWEDQRKTGLRAHLGSRDAATCTILHTFSRLHAPTTAAPLHAHHTTHCCLRTRARVSLRFTPGRALPCHLCAPLAPHAFSHGSLSCSFHTADATVIDRFKLWCCAHLARCCTPRPHHWRHYMPSLTCGGNLFCHTGLMPPVGTTGGRTHTHRRDRLVSHATILCLLPTATRLLPPHPAACHHRPAPATPSTPTCPATPHTLLPWAPSHLGWDHSNCPPTPGFLLAGHCLYTQLPLIWTRRTPHPPPHTRLATARYYYRAPPATHRPAAAYARDQSGPWGTSSML